VNLFDVTIVILYMAHSEPAEESSYRRLRAAYDAAFARLRAEEHWLRLIALHLSPDRATEEALQRRVEGAQRVYRECRDRLADFLASLPPAVQSGASAGCPAEVQSLAYRLWEEAGRPIGNPEQHWYRAEQLLQRMH
jgi:hypothetical protein